MKKSFLILFLLVTPTFLMAQGTCTDPTGCSAVSFAAYQNIVGVVQFGNSTGKVIAKSKFNSCPDANCGAIFTLATAFLPSSSTNAVAFQRREIATFATTINMVDNPFVPNFQVGSPSRTQVIKKLATVNNSTGYPGLVSFLNSAGTNSFLAYWIKQGAPGNSSVNSYEVDLNIPKLTKPKKLLKAPLKSILGMNVSQDGDLFLTLNLAQPTTKSFAPQGNDTLATLHLLDAARTELNKAAFLILDALIKDDSSIPTIDLMLAVLAPKSSQSAFPNSESRSVAVYKQILRTPTTSTISVFVRGVSISESSNLAFAPSGLIGPAVKITNAAITKQTVSEYYQSVGIDPQGRFVVYSKFSPACNKNLLIFQRIDSTLPTGPGTLAPSIKKIGGPKTLAGCTDFTDSSTGAYGLDVINLD